MENKAKLRVLVFLATLSAGVLVISNIVAVKLWDFFGIAVDGGIAIFPLTYIIGDLMVELYGRKLANFTVYVGFCLNILAVLVFLLVGMLPEYTGWDGQAAYEMILGFTPRIVVGSLVAYVVAGLINNWLFMKIKLWTGGKKLWLRALGSSLVAKIFDNVIFKTIAFFGVLGFHEFMAQLIFAYLASLAFELVLTPLTYLLVNKLKKYGFSDF